MGRIGKDTKDLILGNDGSEKEPVDFKTELQNAIKAGLITKADGTLLITSRTNCDKLAELIMKSEMREVIKAGKEDGREFDTLEEAKEYEKEKDEKEKEKEEKKRQTKAQEQSLEQQIQASQNATKAKMAAEKNLGQANRSERNKS